MRVMTKEMPPRASNLVPPAAVLQPEAGRICSQCGGDVEVISIPWKTAAGRTVRARIGACVRCAQWFNEAGLSELEHRALPDADISDRAT
jgi:hypothetical protein